MLAQFGEDGYIQTILGVLKFHTLFKSYCFSNSNGQRNFKKIFIKHRIKTPKYFIHSYENHKNRVI